MTSAYEGLPIAMLEAMALAKPVVATAAGGIPEVIVPGREGLLAPVGDVDLLAAQVNALLANPHAAAEMGRAGRSKVEGRYHTRERVRAMESVYLEILHRVPVAAGPARAGQWPEPCPMTDLYILDWTDESIPRLLELSRATLGAGGAVAKTVAFWRWKHCDNPFGRSYGVYVMDAAPARVAAMRILLRWQFAAPHGAVIRAARAVDTATHPDYQRRGLFSQLTRQAVAGLQRDGTTLIFNTPNAKSLPGYLKMGWSLVDKRTIYVRPLRPMRMLRRRLRPPELPATDDASAFFDPATILPWSAFVQQYGSEFPRLLDEWERNRTQCGWRTPRSEAYYAWRYGQHPHVTYYVHALPAASDSGRCLDGFCVLRPNVRHGWQEVVLCELVLADPSVDAGRRLVRSLLTGLRADYVAAHFAPGSIEYRCVRRCRFLPVPGQGMTFTVRPLCDAPANFTHADDWDLSLGDLEIF